MKIRVRTIEMRRGHESLREQDYSNVKLSIGRGSNQDLTLADSRIPLARATISMRGRVHWIQSESDDPLWIDGFALLEAPLELNRSVDLGRYRLKVTALDAEMLELELPERYTGAEVQKEFRGRMVTSLEETGARIRPWAWLLFLSILTLALAVPAYLRYFESPVQAAELESRSTKWEQAWLSGPVSGSHQHFGDDCSHCHRKPFAQVQVQDCLQCHEQTSPHGQAHEFKLSDLVRPDCMSCHIEHQENGQATLADARICTQCHGDLQRMDLPFAAHFGSSHPEFTAVQDASAGLLFDHALHLDPKGIAGPESTEVMQCQTCHLQDAAGDYQPIVMENHCQRCHGLGLGLESSDPSVQVPHAPLDKVHRYLKDHFAYQALMDVQINSGDLRRPPGPLQDAERRASMQWAEAQATSTLKDLALRRACVTCHEIQAATEAAGNDEMQNYAGLSMRPVQVADRFFRTGNFDHRPHSTQACDNCHAAEISEVSSDLLLPEQAQCVDCHGQLGKAGRRLAQCASCHQFHNMGLDWTMSWDGTMTGTKH